jgi:hypothetical protein
MLADALDHTLSVEEQALFDAHMAICEPCAGMLADARRGAAWLELLRDPRPEPSAELLTKILAQTSGAEPAALAPAVQPAPAFAGPRGVVLPFASRPMAARWTGFRENLLARTLLQPRLAMTAAMAFFSIALTLNLTGVRLGEVHASDLKPASLKRGFYAANARVVQYYEGLRVVYELESRVHDLQSDPGPAEQTPAAAPAAPQQQPGNSQRPQPQRPSPGPGSSYREAPVPAARMVAISKKKTVLYLKQEAQA